jgi:hypothetical protein
VVKFGPKVKLEKEARFISLFRVDLEFIFHKTRVMY